MTDALQFNNRLHNEMARGAVESFASLLKQAFEQYQKVWDDYLELQTKYESLKCKDLSKIIKEEPQDESHRKEHDTMGRLLDINNGLTTDLSKVNSKLKSPNYTFQQDKNAIRGELNQSLDSAAEDSFLNQSVTPCKLESKDTIVESPVFGKGRAKVIRRIFAPKYNNSETMSMTHGDSDKSGMSYKQEGKTPLHAIENVADLVKTEDENEILKLHTPKAENKLGFSTVHTVDTTFLPDGKKLKQTKLIFQPSKSIANISLCAQDDGEENLDDETLFLMKDVNKNTPSSLQSNCIFASRVHYDHNDISVGDVIECSPTKMSPRLKFKNRFKLKRKSPTKSPTIIYSGNRYILKNDAAVKLDGTLCDDKLASPSRTQDGKLIMRKLLHTNDDVEHPQEECMSPSLVDFDEIDIKEHEALMTQMENNNDASRIITNTKATVLERNSLCTDETFFAAGKEYIKNDDTTLSQSLYYAEDVIPERYLSPPAKKVMLNNSDVVPIKKKSNSENIYDPVRKKSERTKLKGFSCWQCKEYFENLGLSEEELQKRKNMCSRHKGQYHQRASTPERFWDPVFPATASSSIWD